MSATFLKMPHPLDTLVHRQEGVAHNIAIMAIGLVSHAPHPTPTMLVYPSVIRKELPKYYGQPTAQNMDPHVETALEVFEKGGYLTRSTDALVEPCFIADRAKTMHFVLSH